MRLEAAQLLSRRALDAKDSGGKPELRARRREAGSPPLPRAEPGRPEACGWAGGLWLPCRGALRRALPDASHRRDKIGASVDGATHPVRDGGDGRSRFDAVRRVGGAGYRKSVGSYFSAATCDLRRCCGCYVRSGNTNREPLGAVEDGTFVCH